MGRCENVLAFGNPGSGKTHLSCALGQELILQGRRVLYAWQGPAVTVGADQLFYWQRNVTTSAGDAWQAYQAQCSTDNGFAANLEDTGWQDPGFFGLYADYWRYQAYTSRQYGQTYYYRVRGHKTQAGASGNWVQTSRGDFERDVLADTTAAAAPGEVRLSKVADPPAADVVGTSQSQFSSTSMCGNFYRCDRSRTLTEVQVRERAGFGGAMITIAVYEAASQDGAYSKLYECSRPDENRGYVSTGALSIPLVAGRFYYVGGFNTTYCEAYHSSGNPSTNWGQALGYGIRGTTGGAPPASISGLPTTNPIVFNQILTTTPSANATSGTCVSTEIAPQFRQSWGALTYSKTVPENTTLTVDVLDGSGSVLMSDVASGVSLAGLTQSAIKLRANLACTDELLTPSLSDWSVTWSSAATESDSAWSNVVSFTNKMTSELTYTGDTTRDYNQPVTLAAHVATGGDQPAGMKVEFVVDDFSGGSTTDANGDAQVVAPACRLAAGVHTVHCYAREDGLRVSAETAATLTITGGGGDIILSGDGFIGTSRTVAKFRFSSGLVAGYLRYLSVATRDKIEAVLVQNVMVSPDHNQATVTGQCTANGQATTFTLEIVDSTNTLHLTTGTGLNIGPATLTGGITIGTE